MLSNYEIYSNKCPICGSAYTEDIYFVEAWQSQDENIIECKHCKNKLRIDIQIVLVVED